MTTELRNATNDPQAERFWEALEAAMLAKTIEHAADLPPERRKALLGLWVQAVFDAAAAGLPAVAGQGLLTWHEQETIRHLIYEAPNGFSCSLGRAYLQPNGTWAALVVAGVGMNEFEAMAKAEWAISRLTG